MPSPDTGFSGGPLTIESGPLAATFRPLHGGRMTHLSHALYGDIVVPTPDAPFEPLNWQKAGAYPLFPYHNRLIGAAFDHDGRTVRVTPNPSLGSDAMHGPAHRRAWHAVDHSKTALTLALDYGADADWPFDFRAMQSFHLSPDQLEVTLTLINTGDTAMPGGMGWHPYFAVSHGRKILPGARLEWPLDPLSVPTGAAPRPRDPQQPLPDDTFTIHLSDWQAAHAMTDGGARLTLFADARLPHLAAHRTPAYACLEPVSHVAGALGFAADARTAAGLALLQPGERIDAALTLVVAG